MNRPRPESSIPEPRTPLPPCSIADSSSKTPNWSSRTASTAASKSTSIASCSWKTTRKAKQTEVEELNRQANEVSKSIGKAKDAAEREALKEQGRQLREQTPAVQTRARRHRRRAGRHPPARSPTCRTPTPRSACDDKANLEVFRGKTPLPKFDFQPLDHVRTGRKAGPGGFRGRGPRGRARLLLPQERGRAAGTGLAALRAGRADGARALRRSDHARPGPERGPGRHRLHSPRAGNANLQHREHRPEPGGHGRDHPGRAAGRADGRRRAAADQALRHQPLLPHRGRRPRPGDPRPVPRPPVHQDRDVRLHPARARATRMLEHLRDLECRLFDGLGIPYRVVDTATGDLGGPAYRKFDLEAWMPGRGEFGEVTSTSQLHRFPGPAAGHPLQRQGREGDPASSTRSTARPSPSAGP